MISVSELPAVNALLNASSAILLIAGFAAIKRRRRDLHRGLMLAAVGASILFLISYLYYHSQVGTTRFTGQGWIRPVYFTILTSHTILAMVIVPLVIATLFLAFRGRFPRHRRIARLTLPTWLYVSVTGILVYLMLYRWYPGAG
jgi:putative membrane protein